MKSNYSYALLACIFLAVVGFLLTLIYSSHQEISWIKTQSPSLITQAYSQTSTNYVDYQAEKYIFATGEYPPYVYVENGQLTGLDYEILVTAFNYMDIDYDIHLLSWSRGTYLLDTGQIFGVFPYTPTKERLKKYSFTSNFFEQKERKSYIYTASEEIYHNLIHETQISSIKNYRLGGIYGYFYIEELNEKGISFDLSIDEEECLNKLVAGKVDLIILDELSGDYIIDQYSKLITTEFYKTNISINSLISGEYLMLNPLNSYSKEFILRFNQAIIELTTDGTIPELLKKYNF
jgi:polar amino acid transport system substrate-binding protein